MALAAVRLRTLLVIIAAIAVQLALWRSGWACAIFFIYVFGFVCINFGVTVGLFLFNLLPWTGRPEERVERFFRTKSWIDGNDPRGPIQLVHGLFLGSFFLTGAGVVALFSFNQYRLESRLQRELGFTYRRESHALPPARGDFITYAAVQTVATGGPFDRAGFQPDDIIVDNDSLRLFQMLARRRGESVELTVIRPLATEPLLEHCPQLVLTVDVPP